MKDPDTCHILILAAGASSRMGQPKQLLPLQEQTVVERVVTTCMDSGLGTVTLVLGAHAEEVQALVRSQAVEAVVHRDWEEGMGSSLAAGIRHILSTHKPEHLMVVLGDQVALTGASLQTLYRVYLQSPKSMAISTFAGVAGPPAVFSSRWYEFLSKLSGDAGAKPVISTHQEEVLRVPLAVAAVDLDTPSDYEAFIRQGQSGKFQP